MPPHEPAQYLLYTPVHYTCSASCTLSHTHAHPPDPCGATQWVRRVETEYKSAQEGLWGSGRACRGAAWIRQGTQWCMRGTATQAEEGMWGCIEQERCTGCHVGWNECTEVCEWVAGHECKEAGEVVSLEKSYPSDLQLSLLTSPLPILSTSFPQAKTNIIEFILISPLTCGKL